VIGSILVVIGLYSVLWGKHKEQVECKVSPDDIPLPIKSTPVNGNMGALSASFDKHSEVKSGQKEESNISLVIINYNKS